jgi:hypothetical protein
LLQGFCAGLASQRLFPDWESWLKLLFGRAVFCVTNPGVLSLFTVSTQFEWQHVQEKSMTKAQRWIFLLGIVFLNVSMTLVAQSQSGTGSGRYMAKYDPKTETTIQATVEEVNQKTGSRGWNGTHLMVKTETEMFEVHVGPSDYVASKGFSFSKGDKIEVTGSKTTLQGKQVLLAREIKKDSKTLTLRDAQGIPNWAGGRRGQS